MTAIFLIMCFIVAVPFVIGRMIQDAHNEAYHAEQAREIHRRLYNEK